MASALLSALNTREGDNSQEIKGKTCPPKKAMSILSTIKKCIDKMDDKHEAETPPKLDNENSEESRKKLISGKCAKPDDTDIKIVVKYPHENLDKRHVKDHKFDSLKFY